MGTLVIPVEVREGSAPAPKPEPSQAEDGRYVPEPQPQWQPSADVLVKQEVSKAQPEPATAAKVGSTAPKTGDAPLPWHIFVIACTSAVIAFVAGVRIRRRDS